MESEAEASPERQIKRIKTESHPHFCSGVILEMLRTSGNQVLQKVTNRAQVEAHEIKKRIKSDSPSTKLDLMSKLAIQQGVERAIVQAIDSMQKSMKSQIVASHYVLQQAAIMTEQLNEIMQEWNQDPQQEASEQQPQEQDEKEQQQALPQGQQSRQSQQQPEERGLLGNFFSANSLNSLLSSGSIPVIRVAVRRPADDQSMSQDSAPSSSPRPGRS